jgi:hypothetical protein
VTSFQLVGWRRPTADGRRQTADGGWQTAGFDKLEACHYATTDRRLKKSHENETEYHKKVDRAF